MLSRLALALVLVLIPAALPACADAVADPVTDVGAGPSRFAVGKADGVGVAEAGLEGRVAKLRFTKDWTTEVVGELVAGGVAYLDYAPERARCTATRGGNPAWTVTAHYRIDGGEVRSVYAAGHAAAPELVGVPLELGTGGELELWFENTDASGCQAWDSDFGANHHFTIAAAAIVPVHFPLGGDMVVGGTAGAEVDGSAAAVGDTLRVTYDQDRLKDCRDTKYGLPAWSILVHWRFPSGATGYRAVTASGRGEVADIALTEGGPVELWFENQGYFGCRAWDSQGGANYRIEVAADPRAPGWLGNAAYVIDRMTCDGGPCEGSRRSLDGAVFRYDTYARQRAAIRGAYFDVWKKGVTDFDNADLWRDLDVQVHYRARADGPFVSRYVDFLRRSGNDARYAVDLRALDPLAGPYTRTDPSQCPDADLVMATDGVYVEATLELYFTVNGVPLRRADGANFRGVYADYASAFTVCLPE